MSAILDLQAMTPHEIQCAVCVSIISSSVSEQA